MNILRHKKWHVRTKENVARVRRDEAKAAEEEKARSDRASLATHEDRVQRLKLKRTNNFVTSVGDIFGACDDDQQKLGGTSIPFSGEQHVNLFTELEEQERKNLTSGNKEYATEKKKEQDDWESKVGIMKRFAEDTKEYSKESEWWERIPLVRENTKNPKIRNKTCEKFLTSEERNAIKLRKEEKKRKKKERKSKRRENDNDPGFSSSSTKEEKRRNVLRQERLAREHKEQLRVLSLLTKSEKKEEENDVDKMIQLNKDRDRQYNSQFNPEFSRC